MNLYWNRDFFHNWFLILKGERIFDSPFTAEDLSAGCITVWGQQILSQFFHFPQTHVVKSQIQTILWTKSSNFTEETAVPIILLSYFNVVLKSKQSDTIQERIYKLELILSLSAGFNMSVIFPIGSDESINIQRVLVCYL